jgi:hypothetical protein
MGRTRAYRVVNREQIVRLLNRLPEGDAAEQLRTASALVWNGVLARKRDSAVRGRLSSSARGRVSAACFLPTLEVFPALPLPVRRLGAGAGADLAGSVAVAELARMATVPDAEARLIAVDALGKIGGPRAVKSLLAAAGDINETVRAEALRALGQLAVAEKGGDGQEMAPVETLLLEVSAGDPSEYVREVAAEALTAIREARLRRSRAAVDRTPSPAVSIPA